MASSTGHALDRCDEDNRATAALEHRRHGILRAVENAVERYPQNGMPFGFVHCRRVMHPAQMRRAIDEDIQATEGGHTTVDGIPCLLRLRCTALHKDALCFGGCGLPARCVDVGDDDISTSCAKRSAIARPMPVAPPVTRAIFPWSRITVIPSEMSRIGYRRQPPPALVLPRHAVADARGPGRPTGSPP